MARLQQSLDKLSQETALLEKEQHDVQTKIAEQESQTASIEKVLVDKRQRVGDMLKILYQAKGNTLQALLTPTQLSRHLEDQVYMHRWLTYHERELAAYAEKVKSLRVHQQELAALMQGQAEREHELRNRKSRIEAEASELGELHRLILNQKEYYTRMVQELETSSQSMDEVLQKWRRTEAGGEGRMGQMRGKLLFPLKGRIELRYGPYKDPVVGTMRYHKGLDLRAPKHSPVRAIFDGRVVLAQWFEGYGKTLIVDHEGGYFSLYAHLDQIHKKDGDAVIIGDIIGTVGDTASLKGPYLYFEFRKKGISEDPLPWLVKK